MFKLSRYWAPASHHDGSDAFVYRWRLVTAIIATACRLLISSDSMPVQPYGMFQPSTTVRYCELICVRSAG